MEQTLYTWDDLRANLVFSIAPPCWLWHRPLTLSNYDDGLTQKERQEIYTQAAISEQEIQNFNVVRYKELGPAFVPRDQTNL